MNAHLFQFLHDAAGFAAWHRQGGGASCLSICYYDTGRSWLLCHTWHRWFLWMQVKKLPKPFKACACNTELYFSKVLVGSCNLRSQKSMFFYQEPHKFSNKTQFFTKLTRFVSPDFFNRSFNLRVVCLILSISSCCLRSNCLSLLAALLASCSRLISACETNITEYFSIIQS